jgi:enoyl-CoA hydratase/carnithine racemase
MGAFVRLEVDDGVGVVRLDRPPANAIGRQVGEELLQAIREADAAAGVGAIVLWGGPKIFAAGADVQAMATWGPEEVQPSVDALGDACDLLEAIGTVSIAAVNGYALGGGMELALACDLRYLADDATLGQPEIKLGVIPGAGGTQRLVRMIGPGRTRELVYTGRLVPAAEAIDLGLAERVLPPDEVLATAVTDAKAAIAAATETPGAAGVEAERAAFLSLFGTPDQREGMAAFLEKRPPRFEG